MQNSRASLLSRTLEWPCEQFSGVWHVEPSLSNDHGQFASKRRHAPSHSPRVEV